MSSGKSTQQLAGQIADRKWSDVELRVLSFPARLRLCSTFVQRCELCFARDSECREEEGRPRERAAGRAQRRCGGVGQANDDYAEHLSAALWPAARDVLEVFDTDPCTAPRFSQRDAAAGMQTPAVHSDFTFCV